MRRHRGLEVRVEHDVSAPMAPAPDAYANPDHGRMPGRVLDVHAEDRRAAAETLRPQANLVDARLKQLLQKRSAWVRSMGIDGAHKGLLGEECRGLNARRHPDTYQQRWARVDPVARASAHALVTLRRSSLMLSS